MDLSPPRRHPAEEFDEYADGYDAGMGNPIKRLVGSSPADFLRVKVRWLAADLRRWRRPAGSLHVLDYGCGQGDFLMELSAAGISDELTGCDTSGGMLDAARGKWDRARPPEFFSLTDEEVTSRAGQYDVITISAVLHHVPPTDRPGVYRNLAQLLKPTGRLYVFEHNPFNPVTLWVVRHTPIDRNAVLVSAPQVRSGLRAAGLGEVTTRYLMFVPPRLTWFQRLEIAFGRIPLGGQFVVRAQLTENNLAPKANPTS